MNQKEKCVMSSLSCRLQMTPPLRISEEFGWQKSLLNGLQLLIGGSFAPDPDVPDVLLKPSADGHGRVRFDDAVGTFYGNFRVPAADESMLNLWRLAVLFAGTAKLLRGENALLMHGCLLKMDDGGGIFLCGQSGMGKSTTATRWKAAGGECPADDMILLEFGADAVYAHPLPTWSHGFEALQNEFYPFESACPVRAILELSRGERQEEIRSAAEYRYMSALYASCAFFYVRVAKRLNSAHREKLFARLKECAEELFGRFPHRTLFANLQSDIKKTLEEFQHGKTQH